MQVHQEQQIYTKARVEACDRDDLDGSREIRYPVRACLDSGESGVMGVDGTSDEDFNDSAQLGKEVKVVLLELLHEDAKFAVNSKVLQSHKYCPG